MCYPTRGHGMRFELEEHSRMCECGSGESHHSNNCCCCGCCCGQGHGLFHRHFLTIEEKLKRLEEYKAQLKKELEAVEERIQKLKGS